MNGDITYEDMINGGQDEMVLVMRISMPLPKNKKYINMLLHRFSNQVDRAILEEFPDDNGIGRSVTVEDMEGNVIILDA